VNHDDHVALIAGGVEYAGRRWLELGAGDGEFTLALADCLGIGEITTVDLEDWALEEGEQRVAARFRGIRITRMVTDFTAGLPEGPFDGVLAANSLHFVADPRPLLGEIRASLGAGGRLIVVEYDSNHGNPYVPHPIAAARLDGLLREAGFAPPRILGRVPSRFLGAIYSAVAALAPVQVGAGQRDPESRVVHSRPHGDDREE
jgi:ubiquinone/menaquinone biosynthesis C-methylase UbiE